MIFWLVFFLFYIMVEVVIGLIFSFVLDGNYGFFKWFLDFMGYEMVFFLLVEKFWVFYLIFVVIVWKYFGFYMMIYIVGF